MEQAARTGSPVGSDAPDPIAPCERFPALAGVAGLWHTFTLRAPGVDVDVERGEALERLRPHFSACLARDGQDIESVWMGEQVHGIGLAVCEGEPPRGSRPEPTCDGLLTATAGSLIGVLVADCCAVYLVDEFRKSCALVHSGKKGTEQGIVPRAIETMNRAFGSEPADLLVQLSPCIRPPAYEIDFAARIREQCRESGVAEGRIHDPGTCTYQRVDRYYSYRREKGRTGRMLAVLGWAAGAGTTLNANEEEAARS